MKRFVTIDGQRFLIRGPYTAAEVKGKWAAYRRKYPATPLTLVQWAAERGHVYGRA